MAGTITGRGLTSAAQAAETAKRGGTLRYAMQVQEGTDPATIDLPQKSNVLRGVVEYLVNTGPDNITRPYLAERWEASKDLKTWTFSLRKGIKWSNGDEFNADDVVFNFERWLNPKTGSSNIGLFSSMVEDVDTGQKDDKGNPVMGKRMTAGAVEKLDPHTVRLNLNSAVLNIPENLYNYPTAIVHRRFEEEGGDLTKNPVGTGPYELAEFRVGEKALLKRRAGTYWGEAPYLDEIAYIDLGEDRSAWLNALIANQVDAIFAADVTQLDVIQKLPDVVLHQAVTALTGVARMQVDQKPFDDIRVRQAVVACMDHQKLVDLAYRGLGAPAENHHVSPIHPEYFKLPPIRQDYAKAKKLLADAGHGNGLKLSIDLGNTTGTWEVDVVQVLKQQLAPAGIDMKVNVMPSTQYWPIWDKTPFGFTAWTHRPLGIMVLNLAYRTGVPWNETHYSSAAFDKALDEASGILDVDQRRSAMEKVEKMLQDAAIIAQPLWRPVFSATHKRVRGYKEHPAQYHQLNKVWLA